MAIPEVPELTPCDIATFAFNSSKKAYDALKEEMDELLADDATLQAATENLSSLSTALSNNAGYIYNDLDKINDYQFGKALQNVKDNMKQVASDTTALAGGFGDVQGDIAKAQAEIEKRIRELKPRMEQQYVVMKNAESYKNEACS